MKELLFLAVFASACFSRQANILWISGEGSGLELDAYGHKFADTPNIDALAKRKMRQVDCWPNAPVRASLEEPEEAFLAEDTIIFHSGGQEATADSTSAMTNGAAPKNSSSNAC